MGLSVAIESSKDSKAGSDDDYDAVGEELADVLGVPEGKREAFFEALQAYVEMCAGKEE